MIDTEKATEYLKNGAQPSPRVVKLLKEQKVKLPKWVEDLDTKKQSKTRNPEKLRKNQPQEEPAAEEAPADAVEPEAPADTAEVEAPVAAEDTPAEEAPADTATDDDAKSE